MEKKSTRLKRKFSNIHYKTGFFKSKKNNRILKYRSSYEQEIFKVLEQDDDVLFYEYEPFFIIYSYHGKIRRYYPDLLVHYKKKIKKLVEIKAEWLIKNPSYFLQRKLSSAYAFSRRHNYIFEIWTWNEKEKKIKVLKVNFKNNNG